MTTLITVTLSANAGIALTIDKMRIWIDAVHNGWPDTFSAVTPIILQKMLHHETFISPDYLFFTHCHPDHYSQKMTEKIQKYWPGVKLILPERRFPEQLILSGKSLEFSDDGVHFCFLRLPHEGNQYAQVPHYGLEIKSDNFCALIAGDCELASSVLAEYLRDVKVDLAILNFPWLTLPRGRSFIKKFIAPKHLLICHLPFCEDDTNGYRTAAEKSLKMLPEIPDIRLLTAALQKEEIHIE